MKLLLDTHVWVWSQEDPAKIGARMREAILHEDNEILVSTISTLEIARLIALGRLRFTMDLHAWIQHSIQLLMATTVLVSHEMAIESYRLPDPFHRDPADRVLVATARIEGATLLTADDLILAYPHVQRLDARS